MPGKLSTALMVVLAGVFLSVSCGVKLERPPVEVTYRPSLIGAGKILRIENRTNVPVRELLVEIRSAAGQVSYEEEELGGFDVLEVGWKKLGGYEIPDDARIEIRAKGYLLSLQVELAASASSGAGDDG